MFRMFKYIAAALIAFTAVSLMILTPVGEGISETAKQENVSNNDENKESLAGRYVGYSWSGEVDGVALKDATTYIETILTLDDDGTISDAKLNTFTLRDGYWTMRQSGNATVVIDYTIAPQPAVPGKDYEPGESMFVICTVDKMSFYTVGVNESGIVAAALVDPITRYQFEMKLPEGFDFSQTVGDFPITSKYNVPTIRTSASGYLRPESWEEHKGRTLFDIHLPWSHVVNSYGTLEGIDNDATIQEFMEALGVTFEDGQPQPMDATYGYFSLGGWHGNARAIENYLIGRNVKERTSLVDWSIEQYARGINEKNQFGVDVETGATRTAQNSVDGISGATVRMSRESTSYQRALVAAGILDEDDVIIGRF